MTEPKVPAEFLSRVIGEWTRSDDDRFNDVMRALLTHLHTFAWEVKLTESEWLAALKFLEGTGKLCDDWRDEYQLLSDVLGLTVSVNDINESAGPEFTESAVLGPFYAEKSLVLPLGSSIITQPMAGGELALVTGRVLDENGKGLAGVRLDLWQVAPNALYAIQDDDQAQTNLRGVIETDAQGNYSFITYKPPPYGIPRDGTVGRLLKKGKRHGMRPAHIHMILTAEGYRSLTTQVFTRDDKYMWSDSVFAEKESLLVDYARNTDSDSDVEWLLECDFRLKSSSG